MRPMKHEKHLPVLDYCRFAAAAAVVCFHYFWNGIANGKLSSLDHVDAVTAWARYGYLGVDLFFMISGYVIFMSARHRTATQFAVGRAVRLYPTYLFAMLATACVAAFLGQGETQVTLKQVLGNLLMYQPLHHQRYVDGVYWTLMLEIRFYVVVGIALAVGLQRRLGLLATLWPLVMIATLVFGHGGWMDPHRGDRLLAGGYYAFFASGALLAMLREKQAATTWLALAASTALGVRYAVALAGGESGAPDAATQWITGAIVLSFLPVFLAINASAGRIGHLPLAPQLGALTYPLYLVHAHIGYMLLSHFATPANRWLAYAAVAATVVALAWTLHEVVEVRMAGFWRTFFERLFSVGDIAARRLRGPRRAADAS
jgi:peptidoglycan/LPS O-acetylase OafA/YrhL